MANDGEEEARTSGAGPTGDERPQQQHQERLPMSPPEGCVRIKEDGGVLKHVVKAGEGDPPCLHARCLGACLCFAFGTDHCVVSQQQRVVPLPRRLW